MHAVVTPPDPTALANGFVDDLGPMVVSAVTGVLPHIAPYAITLALIGAVYARFVGKRKTRASV